MVRALTIMLPSFMMAFPLFSSLSFADKLDEILAAAQQTISVGDGCGSGGLPSLGKTRGTAKNYFSSEVRWTLR